ncbi:MAG: glycosyltransferase family 2 protein [Chloroflexota bacterium]
MLLKAVLILLQVPLALMTAYLDLLAVAAAFRRREPKPGPPRYHFAVLVPAHNEEALLPRRLRSRAALDYPRALYEVYIVADNCTDRTAPLARTGGVNVRERHDSELVGKGYALRWLLGQIKQSARTYDAYVIFDADSVVSPNFLAVMNANLVRGDKVIQGYYGVLNADASWSSGLRYVALVLYNQLRPRGRAVLNLSAGLRGNGMCFAATVLDRFGWEAFTLAEDAEFHLQLVEAGIRVSYADGARVMADMPVTLRQARSQNVRWERGRLQMLRAFGPRLLKEGVRLRDPVRLDAVAEQLVPPLSALVGASLVLFSVVSIVARGVPRLLASCILAGQVVYVATGLLLVRAGPRTYLALLAAPALMTWKVYIYAVAATRLRDGRWVRTSRLPGDS